MIDRSKELETADTKQSKKKVRGRKETKAKEIMVKVLTPDDTDANKIIKTLD